MPKLYSIPNFSKYFITKNGDIFDSVGSQVYHNGNMIPLLYDDNNTLHQITIYDAMNAFCGYLPNTSVKDIGINTLASNDLYYKIDKVKIIDDNTISINKSIFKKINVNPEYYISEYGVVYSIRKNCIIKHNTSKKYRIVNLYDQTLKDRISYYVHHLVYEAYIGSRPTDRSKVIDHIDNHPWNNYYKNLQLITYKENTMKDAQAIADSYNSSLDKHLFNIHGSYSYTNDVIEKICQMMVEGRSSSEISKYFGIEDEKSRARMQNLCYRLRNHLTREDISSKYDFSDYDTSYSKICANNQDGNITSKEMEATICRMLDRGFTNEQISELTDIEPRVIKNINRRKTRAQNIYTSNITSSYNDPLQNAIIYLWNLGLSSLEIKDIIKIPYKTVINYLNQDKGSTTIEKIS